MPLTMDAIASRPELVTELLHTPWGEEIVYRPLGPADVDRLTDFLANTSPETRRLWVLDAYDRGMAQTMCDAINRYDKFRMVAVDTKNTASSMLALFEFAFWPEPEQSRFRSYGIELKDVAFCKFGPCLRDAYQNRGLGSVLMPGTLDIARRFGRTMIVLWGGVFCDNGRGISFYRKHGFRIAGTFENSPGVKSHDMMADLAPMCEAVTGG